MTRGIVMFPEAALYLELNLASVNNFVIFELQVYGGKDLTLKYN